MRPPRAPASAPPAAAPARAPVTPPCAPPNERSLLPPLPHHAPRPLPISQAGSARAARLQGPASAAGRETSGPVEAPGQGLQRNGGTGTGVPGVCVGEGGVRDWGPSGTACAEA